MGDTGRPASSDASALAQRFGRLVHEIAIPTGLVGFSPSRVEVEIRRSLLLNRVVSQEGCLIDVGSGAGFPGLPLAIGRKGTVLIEPRHKAAAFLEHVIRELGLDARVVVQTAEEAAVTRYAESGDFVVARALGPLSTTMSLVAPLCRPEGQMLITAPPYDDGSYGPDKDQLAGLRLEAFRTMTLVEPVNSKSSVPGIDIRQRVHIMSKAASTSPGTLGPRWVPKSIRE